MPEISCPICAGDWEINEKKYVENTDVVLSSHVKCASGHYEHLYDAGISTFTVFGKVFELGWDIEKSRNKNKFKKMRQFTRRKVAKQLKAWEMEARNGK